MMWIPARSRFARSGAALRAILALLFAGACHSATAVPDGLTASSARLLGRWQKVDHSLPPVTLEVRASTSAFSGYEGQVWLSGVTYTLPARLDDSSVVLADPVSSGPAAFVAVLQKDGTLVARLGGQPSTEARLVRQ
ncbi:MAG: hypothetical protein JO180_04155 [Gemmatirosa sp.]|nr:hypothetical protein [Gemmatirosa sp.]